VNGDLCRDTKDCCGAAGTGLPGDGNVVCEKANGATIGICRNPMSCNPQGDVCHYMDYACSISSARNDCCAGVGNSGVCQLDKLGVPRCNGLGDTCRKTGESCASADDCCNNLPCVPDANGALHCGSTTCVAAGGSCTINGDCCLGSSCVTATGSTQGTCSVPPPPPGTGGKGGSGGVGGTTGTSSGGTKSTGGATGGGGTNAGGSTGTSAGGSTTVCALYGQSCTASAQCCNAVPCTNGVCAFPVR
jgi:hypothetical protein